MTKLPTAPAPPRGHPIEDGRSAYAELAARCEAATEPDDALDWAIAEAVGCAPGLAYTASLDAAATLVPSKYYWSAGTSAQDGYEHYDDMDFGWAQTVHRQTGTQINVDYAATPALALCAAALRAQGAT